MRLLLSLLCVNLFALSDAANAQKYQLKEAEAIYDDYLHDIYFTGPDRFVVINYETPHSAFRYDRQKVFTAIAYDGGLKKVYEKQLGELAGQEYVDGLTSGNRLFLFSKDKSGVVYKNELNPASGILVSKGDKLFSFSGSNFSFFKGASPDSAYYYLLCQSHEYKAKAETYQGVIMDRNLKVINSFSFVTGEEPSEIIHTELLLSENGTLSVIQALQGEGSKTAYNPIRYNIRQVAKDGKPVLTVLSGLPAGLLDNIAWKVNKDQLAFTGFLAKTKKSGFTTLVTGVFDGGQRRLAGVKETALSSIPSIHQSGEFYMKDLAEGGFPDNTKLLWAYQNQDGSSYLILEVNSSRYNDATGRWLASGGAHGNMSRYSSSTEYKAGNIYVLKLTVSNEVEWLKVVAKNQIQINYETYLSIAHIKDSNDGLHLFFHDAPINKQVDPWKRMPYTILQRDLKNSALASVYIRKDGTTTKSYIKSNNGLDHHLSPVSFVPVGNQQILYTSYEIRNAGKSTYRLGTVILP